MRNGDSALTYPALNKLRVGRFDGGIRDKVISFSLRPQGTPGNVRYVAGEWLVMWRGLGSSSEFGVRSMQAMR